jgi:hypothetical protein
MKKQKRTGRRELLQLPAGRLRERKPGEGGGRLFKKRRSDPPEEVSEGFSVCC